MNKYFFILSIVLIFTGNVFGQNKSELKNHDQTFHANPELEDIENLSDATMASIITYGNEAVFNNHETSDLDVAALDSNHFVIVYTDRGSTRVGRAVIGTVSGNSITYGDSYIFNTNPIKKPRVACLDSTHFVISYGDSIGLFHHNETLLAGSLSGSVITFGNPVIFSSTYNYFDNPVSSLSENSFVVAYRDPDDSRNGKAIVGTLSGLSISLGPPCIYSIVTILLPDRESPIVLTTLDTSTIAIAYSKAFDTTKCVATIGSVSGNIITFGSEHIFKTGTAFFLNISALGPEQFIIAYQEWMNDNSNTGIALVGNVIGDSISYGQNYIFKDVTSYVSASALDSNHFVVTYWNNENVHSGASTIGTVVENAIYYDDEITYNPDYSFFETVDCFNEYQYVIAYNDAYNGGHPHIGTSIVGTISQYPAITKINSDTICPIDMISPIITENLEDLAEFSLMLNYDTLFQTYLGFQNPNSLLDTGLLEVVDSSGQINISWSSSSSINISSDTLLELQFGNSISYTQSQIHLVWDSNSYYLDSQGATLKSIFHDGFIIKNPLPIDADTIIGNNNLCQGSINESYQTYQITNAASYIWNINPDSAGTIIGSDTVIEVDFFPNFIGIATLSVYGSNTCGDGVSDSLDINLSATPEVFAGSDDEICQNESYLLSGEAFNYSIVNWTTSGDGTFDDPSILEATYFPGTLDIYNKTVNLTLTVIPEYPCLEIIDDQMMLDIVSLPDQPLTPEGPITIDLAVTQTSEYTTSQVANATNYIWGLHPLEAGTIESNDTVGTVFWESSYVGIYAYVYLHASNDCGETHSDSLGISLSPVYIMDNSISDFIVYPNPSDAILSIDIDSKIITEINIYNQLNQIVLSSKDFNGEIDISELTSGIYILEIRTDDLKFRQKIIKK